MRSLFKWALVVMITGATLSGCTTYTNIPEQSGDVARNDPNDKAVLEVMAGSLAAVASDAEFATPFEVVLPAGSTVETYTFVVPKVSKLATSASVMSSTDQKPSGLPVLEVRRLRIRGWVAQVDIVRPFSATQPDGLKQLATVDLKWSPVTDWHVEGVRIWRISVDQALKQSPFGPGEHD